MVSLPSTKFHEILFSSFRGVALTNCVTDRTKTICLPTKVGGDIIIILYWINNLNFVWMLNQNQYLRIKWQASVMSSLMTNMLFLQTRLQITWYLIVNKTHAFGCHNQRTLAFSRSLVILLPKLLEKGILPVFLLV